MEFYNNYNDLLLHAAIPECGFGVLVPLASNVCNRPEFNHSNCGQSEITNANSLVLKLNHGNCSAILPGDALGVTTNDIITRPEPINYNATVLLMSHHGAVLHNANSNKWINGVNPKITPISVGKNKGYGHPSCTVVNNVLQGEAPQLLDRFKMHPLSCFIDGSREFISQGTNQGMVSTFNFGDIYIDLGLDHVTVNDGSGFDLIESEPCISAS